MSETATAAAATSPDACSSSAATTCGNCSPTSANSTELRMKVSTSQNAAPWRRSAGVVSVGACQPTKIPAVTAASTAETSRASAGR